MSGDTTPGTGGIEPKPPTLTDKLLAEVRSALGTLFNRTKTCSLSVLLEAPPPIPIRLIPTPFTFPLAFQPAGVSQSIPTDLAVFGQIRAYSADFTIQAAVSENAACSWQTEVYQTPILVSQAGIQSINPLEGLLLNSQQSIRSLELLPIEAACYQNKDFQLKSTFSKKVRTLGINRFQTAVRQIASGYFLKKTANRTALMVSQPLRKRPVPLSRFSIATKEFFRKVLAEKCGARPEKILLNFVYDRLEMGLFHTIVQDERGHVLCYPKPSSINSGSRPTSAQDRRQPGQARLNMPPSRAIVAYLVFGKSLETQQAVQAVVPVHSLPTREHYDNTL